MASKITDNPIPLAEPDLRGNEAKYLAECVRTNWVSSAGPFVAQFERAMARLIGRGHGVATVNGTAALRLALMGLGIAHGDRVVVPDWTFAATANAVIHAGAEPVFIDVTNESWTLDAKALGAVLADQGTAVKAVIAVHTLGHPADIDPIRDVCAASDVALIEDAAGAIGARYKKSLVGTMGVVACFSFNGNKTVTAGGGGVVVTDDEALAHRFRHLGAQARVGREYTHDAVGDNLRMTNLNAAVGLAQLERLEEMLAAKRAIAGRYDKALAGRDDLRPMPRCHWADSGCWLYSVLTASAGDADRLLAHLEREAIGARKFWQSLSAQPPYACYPRGTPTPVSSRLSGTVVSLPSSSHLSEEQQARVIAALAAWRGAALERAA
jgi:dTDP-4-amino-4,6-dideoxygalactose transaminase